MECLHLLIVSLQNKNNKIWARPHDLSDSLSPSLTHRFLTPTVFWRVCIYTYITGRIKLHVSDDLSPYNNPQQVSR